MITVTVGDLHISSVRDSVTGAFTRCKVYRPLTTLTQHLSGLQQLDSPSAALADPVSILYALKVKWVYSKRRKRDCWSRGGAVFNF